MNFYLILSNNTQCVIVSMIGYGDVFAGRLKSAGSRPLGRTYIVSSSRRH